MMSSNDSVYDASYYDDIYALEVLPTIVILGLLMLAGCVGNSLVCYIYLAKYKPSTTKYFIVSLAVLDLLNCLIGIPFAISLMRYNYTAGRYTYCSVLSTTNHFTSIGSGAILCAVAADRFRRICKPFETQITTFTANIAIAICCGTAVVFAVPAGFIYGSQSVQITTNVSGSACAESDRYEDSVYPLIYNILLFAAFLSICTTIVVLYFSIWRTLASQNRFKQALKQGTGTHQRIPTLPEASQTSTVNAEESFDSLDEKQPDAIRSKKLRGIQRILHLEITEKSSTMDVNDTDNDQNETCTLKRRQQKRRSRKTLMLFLITLVFVLSFLPYLGLTVASVVDTRVFLDLHGAQLFAYSLFVRSYFINSVANPIIYSFFSVKFKQEVRKLFRTRTCLKTDKI